MLRMADNRLPPYYLVDLLSFIFTTHIDYIFVFVKLQNSVGESGEASRSLKKKLELLQKVRYIFTA